jgi:hypothetical protein
MRPPTAAVQWLALALVLGHAAAQWNTEKITRALDRRRSDHTMLSSDLDPQLT